MRDHLSTCFTEYRFLIFFLDSFSHVQLGSISKHDDDVNDNDLALKGFIPVKDVTGLPPLLAFIGERQLRIRKTQWK